MLVLDFIPYSNLLFFTLRQFLYRSDAKKLLGTLQDRLSKVNRLEMTGGGINQCCGSGSGIRDRVPF